LKQQQLEGDFKVKAAEAEEKAFKLEVC